MGLIKDAAKAFAGNVVGVAGSVVTSAISDQYLEFFTCDSLGQDILVREGAIKMEKGKNKGSSEVISNGSIVAVPEGTACLLVDGGRIVDAVMEAGYYKWDNSSSPSILANTNVGENAKAIVKDAWDRFRMGGEIPKQQRVYFVNMLELRDQNFGTASPVPYPDPEYRNIYIRLNGTFSYRIQDPVTFFKNCAGNVKGEFTSAEFMGTPPKPQQPRIEFLDHITEALNMLAAQDRVMYSLIDSNRSKLRNRMQECLDEDWLQNRGIVVEAVAIGGVTPDDKSRERIEQVDTAKLYGQDANALAAQVALGQTEAMKAAGANANGAVNGFMGMGMMGAVGGNNATAAALGAMQANQGQQQPQTGFFAGGAAAPAQAAAGWTCECGQGGNTGKFCSNCGKPQPAAAPAGGWTCECGTVNTGKFCSNCGKPQPAAAPAGCSKCGWKPADGQALPKFCPECGNPLQ
jgi:membrane protease subunit (stomatin/prohibitin family)